ncbi:MAG: type II toxin-antitoxin system RelE/ParE family toxin [archaeon]
MFQLLFRKAFQKSFSKLQKLDQERLRKKVWALKDDYLLGKKLVGYPYWSLRVGRFRVIYEVRKNDSEIEVIELLERKHDYKDI